MAWSNRRRLSRFSGGGCAGVEAAIATTADSRRQAVEGADPRSLAGELGALIALEAPYVGFEPAYVGPVTPRDAANGRRLGDLDGLVVGYSRTFIAPGTYRTGDGFVTFEVYEFVSPEAAVASLEQRVTARCQDAAETFTVDVPGAIGVSLRGSAPPVEDEVLFVRGSRRYLVTRGLGSPDDHHQAATLAEAAAQLAR